MRRGMMQGSFNPSYPNTFIGGVGATSITSKSDFIAKTRDSNLYERDIYLFEIDAYNNVSFFIKKQYILITGAFQDDVNITYFIDSDSKCTHLDVTVFMKESTPWNLKFVYASKAELDSRSNPRTFSGQRVLQEISVDAMGNNGTSHLTQTGSSVGGVNVYCNVSAATSNGGSPNPALMLSNVNPIYRFNETKPSKINDLTVSDVVGNYVRFNFSTPSSVNNIYKYEVWDANRFLGWTNGSGQIFSGLTPATNYNFRLVTVDHYYNRSEFSNTVNITTL